VIDAEFHIKLIPATAREGVVLPFNLESPRARARSMILGKLDRQIGTWNYFLIRNHFSSHHVVELIFSIKRWANVSFSTF